MAINYAESSQLLSGLEWCECADKRCALRKGYSRREWRRKHFSALGLRRIAENHFHLVVIRSFTWSIYSGACMYTVHREPPHPLLVKCRAKRATGASRVSFVCLETFRSNGVRVCSMREHTNLKAGLSKMKLFQHSVSNMCSTHAAQNKLDNVCAHESYWKTRRTCFVRRPIIFFFFTRERLL